MNYFLGEIIVDGTTEARTENDPGIVCIGGDLCDVYAGAAYGEDDGTVRLVDVTVVSSLVALEKLKGQALRDELVNMTTDTISACYASIGRDTFRRCKRTQEPLGETKIVPA